jgi:hypothetical protein
MLENFGIYKGLTIHKLENGDSIFIENFSGSAPDNSLGNDGDRALDLSTICLYIKIAGVWQNVVCAGGAPPIAEFPNLTNPSMSFSLTQSGLREIGEILDLNFTAFFNRGSISPQYTADSPFRSGLPNTYSYTNGLPTPVPSTNLSNAQTLTNYEVVQGVQSWQASVSYDGGVQPKDSFGDDFNSPLPPGTVGPSTVSITGVYPWFATSIGINTLTKQPLALMTSTFVQVTVVAEPNATDKQKVEFPDIWPNITGVRFFNTITNTWDWLGGSAANSLTFWDLSSTTQIVQGNVIDYVRFTHNGPQVGSRQLRFYT